MDTTRPPDLHADHFLEPLYTPTHSSSVLLSRSPLLSASMPTSESGSSRSLSFSHSLSLARSLPLSVALALSHCYHVMCLAYLFSAILCMHRLHYRMHLHPTLCTLASTLICAYAAALPKHPVHRCCFARRSYVQHASTCVSCKQILHYHMHLHPQPNT